MSIALVYAAEAYHTKGAMRHVVGVMQLKKADIKQGMTLMDYWVSMIENWADANKGFSHCGNKNAKQCLLSMTKYLYRTFDALKIIRNTLYYSPALINKLKIAFKGENPAYNLPSYPHLDKACDPQKLTKNWVANYKNKVSEIPEPETKLFLSSVGCLSLSPPQAPNTALTRLCMDKIQVIVKSFDNLLVKTTAKETTQNTVMHKKDGTLKTVPVRLMRKE